MRKKLQIYINILLVAMSLSACAYHTSNNTANVWKKDYDKSFTIEQAHIKSIGVVKDTDKIALLGDENLYLSENNATLVTFVKNTSVDELKKSDIWISNFKRDSVTIYLKQQKMQFGVSKTAIDDIKLPFMVDQKNININASLHHYHHISVGEKLIYTPFAVIGDTLYFGGSIIIGTINKAGGIIRRAVYKTMDFFRGKKTQKD